jgi:ATP-dependent DNA helicase RecQ
MILTNPECLANQEWQELLVGKISHIVIDEAHTVSQWGDTFRPAYLKLQEIIPTLQSPLITAFTATASESICQRIKDVIFQGNSMHRITQTPDRPNIFYSVQNPISKIYAVKEVLDNSSNLPAIIFCSSRSGVEITARQLNRIMKNSTVKFYHAGLEREEKQIVEQWFFHSDRGILVATCAYGMA